MNLDMNREIKQDAINTMIPTASNCIWPLSTPPAYTAPDTHPWPYKIREVQNGLIVNMNGSEYIFQSAGQMTDWLFRQLNKKGE